MQAIDVATEPVEGERRSAGPWSPAFRLTTAGLLLIISSGAFETLAVATIMPDTVDDLGGLRFYGWAFSAYMLTNLLGLVVAGGESDRSGPRFPFLLGVAFFTTGLLVGGFAPTMIVLILGRAIQGFGAGLFNSVAYVVVSRGYPDSARPKAMAMMSTAWVLPGLVGPAIAGLIADHVGWRWVFLGIAPLPVLALVLVLPALDRIPGGIAVERNWKRIRNATLLAVGTAILLAGLGEEEKWMIGAPLAVGGAVLAWRILPRLLPAGTVRVAPGLPAAIATMGLLNLAFFGVDAFVPLALTDIRGTSTRFAGLALTAATMTWTAGSWLQAHWARRVSPRKVIRVGFTLLSLGFIGMLIVILTDISVYGGVVAWAIAGIGIGMSYASMSLVVVESAPTGEEGTATSSMQLTNTLGAAVATGFGGAFVAILSTGDVASKTSLTVQFLVMVGVLAVAYIAAQRLPARPRLAS